MRNKGKRSEEEVGEEEGGGREGMKEGEAEKGE